MLKMVSTDINLIYSCWVTILPRLGAFLEWFAQNTPNLCNLGSFVSDENPLIAIPNLQKKKKKKRPPQKAGTCT